LLIARSGDSPTYLAKVHFIEDYLIGVGDTPEPCDEGKRRHYCYRNLVVPFWLLLARLVGLRFLEEVGGLLGDKLC
jgi:hypothetical protein